MASNKLEVVILANGKKLNSLVVEIGNLILSSQIDIKYMRVKVDKDTRMTYHG